MTGTLYLVVGPSGAGKDTLIDGARRLLADEGEVVFARRWITRPADAGGEDHVAVAPAEFDAADAEGAFALAWRAHGLAYGIPATIAGARERGASVVANVSRSVIDDARGRLAPVRVILIDAPDETLAERLRARGRESEGDIRERLARARASEPVGDDVIRLLNDRSPEWGIEAFARIVRPSIAPAKD